MTDQYVMIDTDATATDFSRFLMAAGLDHYYECFSLTGIFFLDNFVCIDTRRAERSH